MLRLGTFMAVMVAFRAFGADDACTGAQTLALRCAAYGTYSAYSCDPATNAALIAIAAKVNAAAEAKKAAVAKDRASLQAACRDSLQLNQEYVDALEQFKTACESQRQTCVSFCASARPSIPTCPADATALAAAVTGSETGCQNLANRVSQAANLQNQARVNIALANTCLSSSSATTAPPSPSAFGVPPAPTVVVSAGAGEAPEKIATAGADKRTLEAETAEAQWVVLESIYEVRELPPPKHDEVKTAAVTRERGTSGSAPAARATASLSSGSEASSVSTVEKSAKPATGNPDLRRFLPGSDLSPDRLSGREEGHKLGLCPRTRGLFECVSERYRSQLDKLIRPEEEFSK